MWACVRACKGASWLTFGFQLEGGACTPPHPLICSVCLICFCGRLDRSGRDPQSVLVVACHHATPPAMYPYSSDISILVSFESLAAAVNH